MNPRTVGSSTTFVDARSGWGNHAHAQCRVSAPVTVPANIVLMVTCLADQVLVGDLGETVRGYCDHLLPIDSSVPAGSIGTKGDGRIGRNVLGSLGRIGLNGGRGNGLNVVRGIGLNVVGRIGLNVVGRIGLNVVSSYIGSIASS